MTIYQTHPGAMHPSELIVGFQMNPDQNIKNIHQKIDEFFV